MPESTYPLSWPSGWKRTASSSRDRARFRKERQPLTVWAAIQRLQNELERLGARDEILSTNLRTRMDGMPRSDQANPDDPGVAVYFTLKKKRTVLACDKWDRVADNIAALAAHIECLRGIDRYGVGTLEQAFRGYLALEDFTAGIPWRRVLGFKEEESVTVDQVNQKYRELMKLYHTDITKGDSMQAAQLNLAIEQARTELRA
ncbi:MAG TPA: hypothetical protein VMU05_00425 [Dongiaceae bacterium]|nr:hypothetical protein [Dongiaceae bacterium]